MRCSMRFLLYALMAVMMLCVADPSVFAKDKESKLPQQYREWLDRDVAYIITRGEKTQFLSLTSDAERDKFIDWFWAIRNLDHDSPVNAYREEHYRRLTYADDHFGIGKRVPGWATPRGRIYITLGAPKQLANYQGFDRVRPMQIWFYESTSPALPPYFYVLFYKKDSFGDYITYSPYFDGPQDLITERGMSDSDAVQQIYRDLGQEVARTALSLLPDEPVDTNNPRPSMQSDVMMSQIHDLANSSYSVAALQRRAAMMTVSARLIVGGETLGILTAPLRDSDGSVKVHYLMRLRKPEDFALAKSADGGYYISLEARVQVLTSEDKPIFTQERNFKHAVGPEQLEQVKHKVLGYEDWLPLPPGHYHLKFSLGNPVNSIAYQAEAHVVVPEVPASGFSVTPMISFTSAEAIKPELSGMIPFSTAGVRFSPLLAREMNYSPATDLQFFYQIWASPDELKKGAGNILEARYAFGRPGGVGEAKIVTDQVEAGQLDSAGTLLTGKKIPLGDWAQGNYLLTLSLDGGDKRQQASATMTFRLLLASPVDPDFDVFDGEAIARDVRTGITDYQRGLCFLAFDRKEDAERAFRASLRRSPSREEARSALVNLEAAQNNLTALTETAREFPITSSTDDEIILLMAGGLDKAGSTKEAISLLQTALKLKSPNSHVYLTLASYYRQLGDTRAGEDFERKGQALAAQHE